MLGRKSRDQLELFVTGSLEQLVPEDHVLARVDRARHDIVKCPRGKVLRPGRVLKYGRFFHSRSRDCARCTLTLQRCQVAPRGPWRRRP